MLHLKFQNGAQNSVSCHLLYTVHARNKSTYRFPRLFVTFCTYQIIYLQLNLKYEFKSNKVAFYLIIWNRFFLEILSKDWVCQENNKKLNRQMILPKTTNEWSIQFMWNKGSRAEQVQFQTLVSANLTGNDHTDPFKKKAVIPSDLTILGPSECKRM